MKSIPVAAFAIGLFVFGALAMPIIGPFSFLTGEIYQAVGVDTKRDSPISQAAPTAVLLSWNTWGNTGTETTEPSVSNDPNLSSSNLTLGSGVTPAANANRFGGINWWDTGDSSTTTLAQSIAGNDYIEFIVTPNSGYSFTPTSFVFVWDRSSSGPQNVTLRSSADGFTTDLGSVSAILTGAFDTNTINISGLTNLTSATTFRLYGYGGTAAGGTGGLDTPNSTTVTATLNGSTAVAPVPEMDVRGNNVSIVDGDSTPSLTDHTDFGSTTATGGTVVRTFAIHNTGTANLTVGAITLGGTNAGDFSIDNTGMSPILAPGGNTAFNVTFDPTTTGLRTATVSIVNNDADENPYDFAIEGTGNPDPTPTPTPTPTPVTRVVDTLDDSASADECTSAPNDCSLRRAIATSNNGDTVTFDPALFGSPLGESVVASPQTIVLGGTAIDVTVDLTITGPGSDQLTVDANGTSRVFAIGQNVTVSMSGMTVTGGNGLPQGGGGIFIDALSYVSLTGMTITGNTAARGGGILALSPLTITDSVISGNSVNEVGGGIRADWALTITNSTISGNTAGTGAGIFGSVEDGGDASLTVSGSTFYDNCSGTRLVGGACSPSGGGGAIEYNTGVYPFTIENSTFSGNSGGLGGGIVYFSTAGSVKSTTFVNSSIFTISLPMSNTIISGGGCNPGIVDLGYNLDSGNSCGFTQPTSKINTDPLLGPLQNNGGPTLTHGFNLALGLSPAIDAGSAFGLTTDQRGMPRTVDIPGVANAAGGDGTDIGAFELMAPTAAPASISGRVLTSRGAGISGVTVAVQGTNGGPQIVNTNTFGYFQVSGLPVGQTYIVTVSSRKYGFVSASQVVNLDDNVDGVNFVASP